MLALAGPPACDPSEGCSSSFQAALVSGGRRACWRSAAPEGGLACKPAQGTAARGPQGGLVTYNQGFPPGALRRPLPSSPVLPYRGKNLVKGMQGQEAWRKSEKRSSQKCNITRFPEQPSEGQRGSGAPCADLTIKLFLPRPGGIETVLVCEPDRCPRGAKPTPPHRLLRSWVPVTWDTWIDFLVKMSQVPQHGCSVSVLPAILSPWSGGPWPNTGSRRHC